MAGDVRDYSPTNVTATWGSVIFDSGAGDGTFISVTYPEDNTAETVGADGSIAVVTNVSKLVTITVTLSQTAPKNAELSAVLAAAELAKVRAEAPFAIADRGGTTLLSCSKAWVKKRPDVTFSKAHETRAWTFAAICENYFAGGN